MKKKVLSALLVAAMATSMFAGCGAKNDTPSTGDTTEAAGTTNSASASASGDKTITIWAADAVAGLTEEKASAWVAENYPDYTVKVEPVGEGDAAGNMITDVAGGADIFGFAQDQLSRLVAAGAVNPLTEEYATWVKDNNDSGASAAAALEDLTYAFPMTSDNGYFLMYDKSIVTDPTSLEAVIKACEDNGKGFYFNFTGAWYNASLFFGTGCDCEFTTDADGNFTGTNANYASEQGVVALREMIDIANSPATLDTCDLGNITTEVGAIISGTWVINDGEKTDDPDGEADSGDETTYTVPGIKTLLGDNFACTKLPSFEGSDGKTYQMSGFGGFKLLGVKPQEDAEKLGACYALAQYLTDTDMQLERYNSQGWGPSNVAAQGNEAVQADEALVALGEQLALSIPQGQYPGDWWNTAGNLVKTGEGDGYLTQDASDDDLMAVLKVHDEFCASQCQ